MILSKVHPLLTYFAILTILTSCISIRTKLADGTITVSGDQWPLLVYADQEYDSNDPWNGLFRSKLLVWVSVVPRRIRGDRVTGHLASVTPLSKRTATLRWRAVTTARWPLT
jgi:hypothetical protein